MKGRRRGRGWGARSFGSQLHLLSSHQVRVAAFQHRSCDCGPALEFDGPSHWHFTRNTLEPLGHTRLRDRLLSAMGWHVVSIPFFEWDCIRRKDLRSREMPTWSVECIEACSATGQPDEASESTFLTRHSHCRNGPRRVYMRTVSLADSGCVS